MITHKPRARSDEIEPPLHRHARACRGHPRFSCLVSASKAWMAGTSPAMTPEKWLNMTGTRSSSRRLLVSRTLAATALPPSASAGAASAVDSDTVDSVVALAADGRSCPPSPSIDSWHRREGREGMNPGHAGEGVAAGVHARVQERRRATPKPSKHAFRSGLAGSNVNREAPLRWRLRRDRAPLKRLDGVADAAPVSVGHLEVAG